MRTGSVQRKTDRSQLRERRHNLCTFMEITVLQGCLDVRSFLERSPLLRSTERSPGPRSAAAEHLKAMSRSIRPLRADEYILGSLVVFCLFTAGCRSSRDRAPEVRIIRAPDADPGGPEKLDYIEGTVQNGRRGQHIVLYAHSGIWWVQPFSDRTTTNILPDGTWKNSTHLGTDYAALLVDADYAAPAKMPTLPALGNGVAAVATVSGRAVASIPSKTIHFSGYDWAVRATGSDRGGEANAYDVSNAWLDDKGFLHLRTSQLNGRWTCAEVALTRSLGYGTYKFTVQDSAHLPPSAVVTLLTFDDLRTQGSASEIDIELSRWGDPKRKNSQFVIQPYYVPENVFRFESPAGSLTHSFHWEPGRVTFQSETGSAQASVTRSIASHAFSSGVPVPAKETVRMNLYDFQHSHHPSQPPAEVVIEKFEYLP